MESRGSWRHHANIPTSLDAREAAAALAAADSTVRQAVARGQYPSWFGVVWTICVGAIYWLCALDRAWHLAGTAVVIAVMFGTMVVRRRTRPVQSAGFVPPRTVWTLVLMVVVMIGVYVAVDLVPEPAGVQWQWIITGFAMTIVGAGLWWMYNTVFRCAQLRYR